LREPEITDVAFTPVEAEELEAPEMDTPEKDAAPTDDSTTVAIEPEQAAEEGQGPNLDEPIA